MIFSKPPLSFSEQADLILSRGLIADRDSLISCLSSVNYYRLSGYLYPYRNSDDTFRAGTTLDMVLRHYSFDQKLRILVLDAIEIVEVGVRTSVVYHFAHANGPFGHVDYVNMRDLSRDGHQKWLEILDEETNRSTEAFVDHFKNKYGANHQYLPIWMASEIMTFGALLTMFKGMNNSLRQKVARDFSMNDVVLKSWLIALNGARNICAHHGRLWNRELGYKPKIPRGNKYPDWHTPVTISQNRVFVILTILKYLISIISPECVWSDHVRALLDEYPDISRVSMGFPHGWETSPLWEKNN
ncbi:Abi family protein [Candidatus Latescibacterota bacterium]